MDTYLRITIVFLLQRWLVEDNNVMLNVASDANDLASYVVSDTPVSFFGEVRDGLSYTSYAFFPKGKF